MAKRRKKTRSSTADAVASSPWAIPFTGKIFSAQQLLPALAIIAAGLWIYWPSLGGAWLWDDQALVGDNVELRSWTGLWKIWFAAPTTDYWPLTWSLLWIEWHVSDGGPLLYHLSNLVLHLCSGFLIWRLLNRLGLRRGWIGGLLFVIHPLAVESVAWISEIKNTLSLPFYLLSLDAWLDEEEGKSSGYGRSLLFYLASMLAKTSSVMLPLVLLLYCWWKRGRIAWIDLKRILPYLGIALFLGFITIHFQARAIESGTPLETYFGRFLTAAMAVLFYLWKFTVPIGFLPIYPRWMLSLPSKLELLAPLILVFVVGGLWIRRRSWGRTALLGAGFFLLNLFPVLGFLDMTYLSISWVADHFVYLPMVGLIGLVTAGLETLLQRIPRVLTFILTGSISIIGIFLAWESHGYSTIFENPKALWTYTLAHNPGAAVGHYNMGVAFQADSEVEQAMEEYKKALSIKPDYAEAHNNLGNALTRISRLPEAIEQYKAALKSKPDYAEAHNNLADALAESGRVPEAIQQYKEALQITPDYEDAHYNLAVTLQGAGRLAEAIEQYKQALQIKPDFIQAREHLAAAQAELESVPPKNAPP